MVSMKQTVALCMATLAAASPVDKRASCTFTDAQKAMDGQASCDVITIGDMTVPAGTTLDFSDLNDGTTINFTGEVTWAYKAWEGPLLQIKGNGITVEGATGHVLNGNGAKWWDGEGSNGGVTKPKFFYAHSLKKDSLIRNLNIKNTPVQAVSVNGCEDLVIKGMTIDNSDGDSAGGHNTDGFDVGSSTGVTITKATVKNQDDCIAINSGVDITMENSSCSGGHGISIGSVGGRSDNVVQNIAFKSNTVTDSTNGIRIKTVQDTTGEVTGVTYSDITLDNISDYGILIEQNYKGGDLKGTATSGVPITDVVFSGVKGSVASDGTNIAIVCGSSGCSDWSWSSVIVSGGEKYDSCENIPSGATC